MHKIIVLGIGAAFFGLAGVCYADTTITADESILSGVQDASNMWSASTTYGFQLNHSASDSDFYLNSIGLTDATTLVGGGTFDPNANFTVGGPVLGNGFSSNTYTLGTAITGDQTFYWSDVVRHNGAFDSSAAPVGLYSFDAVFTGGSSATDDSVVIDVPLELEIVNTINANVTTQLDTNSIGPGQTATVSATLQNNMTDRNFVTTTWFLTGQYSGPNGLAYNFVGNWFDQTIAPGASLSGQHSTWTDTPTVPIGTYVGTNGIVGGLYNGDNFYFATNNNTSIDVTAVPEPTSLIGLALGVAAFVRRKRARA